VGFFARLVRRRFGQRIVVAIELAIGPRHRFDGQPSLEGACLSGLLEALNHLGVAAAKLHDDANQLVELWWKRFIDGFLSGIVAAGAEIAALLRRDENSLSSTQ